MLRQRCAYVNGNVTEIIPEDVNNNRFCSINPAWGRQCPYPNSTCLAIGENPNDGITSFDNFFWTFIVFFQSVTTEGWSDIMYWIMDTNGSFSQAYFVLVVIFGGLLILNLLLAVLAVNITVQREIDQAIKDDDLFLAEDIERSLWINRLIVQENHEEEYLQRKLKRFLWRYKIKLKDSIEMRLMLSYERMKDVKGYNVVNKVQYELYAEKHKRWYPRWKAVIVPILDQIERIAAAKRIQQARMIERETRIYKQKTKSQQLTAQVMDKENDDDQDTEEDLPKVSLKSLHEAATDLLFSTKNARVTPPFIREELQETELVAKLQAEEFARQKHNQFVKADSFLREKREGIALWLTRVEARPYAGERLNGFYIEKICFKLVSQYWFNQYLMNAIIILNVLVLSVIYFNQPVWMFQLESISDIAFNILFLIEMLLKITGFGFLKYWTSPQNSFDGIITLLSLLQFLNSDAFFVAIFRSIRLLRLVRLLTRLKSMNRILLAGRRTLYTVFPFLILVFLFVYIFTVIGLQLFGGILQLPPSQYDCTPLYPNFPHCPPYQHFDNFYFAFLTSFQVLMKNNWNNIMYEVVSASSFVSFFYFLIMVLLGSFILLNIFLGVLIDSFLSVSEELNRKSIGGNTHQPQVKFEISTKTTQPKVENLNNSNEEIEVFNDSFEDLNLGDKQVERHVTFIEDIFDQNRHSDRILSNFSSSRHFFKRNRRIDVETEPELAKIALKELIKHRKRQKEKKQHWRFHFHASYPYRIFIFNWRGDNFVRTFCGNVVLSPPFHYLVMIVIWISSIAICFEGASTDVSLRAKLNSINDFVFVVFALEFSLKILSFGIYGHPGAYFREGWNILDFALLCTLILGMIFAKYEWVSLVQMCRAFYPLRIIRYVDSLKVALHSISS